MIERNFKGIWIPKEIWLSENLTLQEKIFLVEIDSLDNENGCFASNSYFAEFFGLTTQRVSVVVNALKEKGFLDIEFERKGKAISKRIIKILRPPYPILCINETLKGYQQNIKGVSTKHETGYQQNIKDNNILNNNTLNNTKDNLKDIYTDCIHNVTEKYDYQLVIDYLNQKYNKRYKLTKSYKQHIEARFKEGFTLEDFKLVVDNMIIKWGNDNKMAQYIRPETLFNTKFQSYLNVEITNVDTGKLSSAGEIMRKRLENIKLGGV